MVEEAYSGPLGVIEFDKEFISKGFKRSDEVDKEFMSKPFKFDLCDIGNKFMLPSTSTSNTKPSSL